MERDILFHRLEDSILLRCQLSPNWSVESTKSQNPSRLCTHVCVETDKLDSKIHVEMQGTSKSKTAMKSSKLEG